MLIALGIGAVATVAAVGADELTMKAVHLRAADLALPTGRLGCVDALRLL